MIRAKGKLHLIAGNPPAWIFDVNPALAMRIKRIFPRMEQSRGTLLRVKHTDEVANDIEWVLMRWNLALDENASAFLRSSAQAYREKLELLESIAANPPSPESFELAIPLREYQAQATALYLGRGALLNADVVGAGKTATAIASFTDPRAMPAAVIVKAHLPAQWREEIAKFLPSARVHVVKSRANYELPPADVYVISYSKLDAWYGILAEKCRSVVFDEIQELRIPGSQKYTAARQLTSVVPFKYGLSATPIHNYGSEAWCIFNLLAPDSLGSYDEFWREWCTSGGVVKDPEALGAYLRQEKLMVRRTRKDIGRELPPIVRNVQDAVVDEKIYQEGITAADELARVVLSGAFLERGQAAREFDLKLRQATGLAKAPFVAELVRWLVESGEQVLLGGWHRAVYDVWRERLKEFNPVFFTGTETAVQKEAARQAFIEGRSKVLIMSLRSGAGTNGLQDVCSCAVLGELDWTPAVHEQFIGRLARDGQTESVQVYIPVASVGCDPTMAGILGLKQAQSTGIVDLGKEIAEDLIEVEPHRVKQLAVDFLKARGLPVPEINESASAA
jgi:hypothetical protein